MRILAIQHGKRTAPRRLHSEFLTRLSEFNDYFIYGPRETKLSGEEVAPLEFSTDISLKDLEAEFHPDIIILPENVIMRIKSFKSISSSLRNNEVSTPVVIIEIDSFYVEDLNWFAEYNIDYIIDRGPDTKHVIPSVWLPLSAKEEHFFIDPSTDYLKDRFNKLVFVGGGRYSKNKYYASRQRAIRLLEAEELLTYIGEVGYGPYPIVLKSYIGALGCSLPPLHHYPGKTFEIMASGTALLTSKMQRSDQIFGNKECFFTYKDDTSNVIEVAREMLEYPDKTKEIIHNALTVVNEKHLDKHRIVELQNILEAIVYGKEVPDVWGEK